jgi:hypothetical protein
MELDSFHGVRVHTELCSSDNGDGVAWFFGFLLSVEGIL